METRLFDAEYRLMDIVWEKEPVNSTELSRLCEQRLGWKKSTTYNMIRKLADHGVLRNEKATVVSLVRREEILRQEGEELVEKAGSLPAFLAAFLASPLASPASPALHTPPSPPASSLLSPSPLAAPASAPPLHPPNSLGGRIPYYNPPFPESRQHTQT